MPRIKDLVGQRFGKLIVVAATAERRGYSVCWECRCDCGRVKIISTTRLKDKVEPTRSCGCLQREVASSKRVDLTGLPFGRWTVQRFSHTEGEHYHWLCRCDCGNSGTPRADMLQAGESKSCGCLRADRARETGRRSKGCKWLLPHPKARSVAEQDEMIREYQSGSTLEEVADAHGLGITSTSGYLTRRGIKMRGAEAHRIYQIDDEAFSEVTPDGAYFTGLIMADGCVCGDRLMISLQKSDRAIVERLRQFLKTTSPLREKDARNSTYGGSSQILLSVSSRQIVADLSRYGITPRKSLTAKAIGVEWNRHFWRGVIDGDGCLTTKDGGERPQICLGIGAIGLATQFSDFARAVCPVAKCTVHRTIPRRRDGHPHAPHYSIHLSGKACVALVAALYDGAAVALDRKAKIAERIMRWKGRRDSCTPPIPAVAFVDSEVPHALRG